MVSFTASEDELSPTEPFVQDQVISGDKTCDGKKVTGSHKAEP